MRNLSQARALALALSLVACSGGPAGNPRAGQPQGWRTFTDPAGRFSFAYPPDWTVQFPIRGYRSTIDPNDPSQTSQDLPEAFVVPGGQPEIDLTSEDPRSPFAWFVEVYLDPHEDPQDLRSSKQANTAAGWGSFTERSQVRSGHAGGVLEETLNASPPPSYSGPEWCGGCVNVDYYFDWGTDGVLIVHWDGAPEDIRRWGASALRLASTVRDPRA